MDAGKQAAAFPSFLHSDAATKIWNTSSAPLVLISAARTEWKKEEKALH
jgi:hypothetical protein